MNKARIYTKVALQHFSEMNKMLFLEGPRQVGKTTIAAALQPHFQDYHYLNWDISGDQAIILSGADAVAEHMELVVAKSQKSLVVFDEIHKFSRWQTFVKGFFDKYHQYANILVTGSTQLGFYRRGGDSMMGRYFPCRVHPFSVAECITPDLLENTIRSPKRIALEAFEQLYQFGGFPEPLLQANTRFSNRWQNLWHQQLFKTDLREVSRIQELAQIELLAKMLSQQTGQLVTYSNLAKLVQVSVPTIKHWIQQLSSLHYCFVIQPWSSNISRALIKQPKVYCWNWSEISDPGARFENFIASHLLKAVQFWTDYGFGQFGLYFIRDTSKRELDFVVTKDNIPWFLVEAKVSDKRLSKNLGYFQQATGAKHAFQVVLDLDYIDKNCFDYDQPVVVSAKTFLSQLV